MSSPFTVLTVCTGNVCRSPAAERLLAARLGPASGVVVSSAGTGALVGASIPTPMAMLVTAAGASPDAFAARQLTEQILRESDLVLTLTRGHRARVVDLWPGAVRRTFTLRELARLAEAVGPHALRAGTVAERFAALVPLATATRATLATVPPDEDDVIDPYRRSDAVYAASFGQLRPAVETLAAVLHGHPGPRPPAASAG
ncbi:low molecular weight phosphatase family protein [Sanguibacter sp. 25GB23B1]|uniref:arsenate reductase/protein-tyrosine-phosphatase family protein n=1 Tax=unclassified Sanguibacter TaxID=2645534 RepID=UPI0032AF69CC